jgi:hypothetical protein
MSSQSFQISENALTNELKSSKEKTRGFWSYNEDCKLLSWIQTKGPKKWTACAQTIPGRTGKQCRERWFNALNPEVKTGQWTIEEDYKIYVLYSYLGGKWSKIAKYFSNRTENSIKNRFYSSLRKLYSEKVKVNNIKNEKCNLKSSSVGIKELKQLFPVAKEMLAEKIMIVKHMNKDEFEIYEKEIANKIKSGKKVNRKNNLLFKLGREKDKSDINETNNRTNNKHNSDGKNEKNNSISDLNSEEEISFLEKEAKSLINLSTINNNNNNNNDINNKPNTSFPFCNTHSCLFTSFNNTDYKPNINNIYSNLLREFTDLEKMIKLSKDDVSKTLKTKLMEK